ncbi:hypothetical protein MKZ38_005589 [Zalerion maritima]|uniref:Homeobox domain-containing protein n=1 Tax=Zalerion maritima TaxID=339359 RepID=A0AAD5WQ74_9PEZI|nr:hypothetical protein MKZ38_005589 [Zalerion maritima]
MLVTRQFEPEHNHWSMNKLETIFRQKPPTSPRMSSFDATPLSTQPDWQGQYSYLPPGDNLFSQSYDQNNSSSNGNGGDHTSTTGNNDASSQPRTTAIDSTTTTEVKTEEKDLKPTIDHRDPLGLRKQPSLHSSEPQQQSSQPQQEPYPQNPVEVGPKEESLNCSGAPPVGLGQVLEEGQGHDGEAPAGQDDYAIKEDEDDMMDEDDMGDSVDGDGSSQPQTAAERTAQRRKMKRFRLTHQQTRFLMSEFAKQPHPDAAHRERLSREIPGLSPRQVQVWFQNRRAKIKRLTADDRDRMVKMRAVPDDFDNVQALHSPYGAVHGLGTPITSPVDFGTPASSDHMMRPMVMDGRRPDGDEHISPTGLSPAFGTIGFSPSAGMSSPDLLSPLSPTANDRYPGYQGHMSAPLSAGPRTSNPFARQVSSNMDLQNRPQMRSLQPLQLRDTMNRSRSESLQSPLRTSMSWKGNSLDYSYSGGNGSPQQMGGRHGSSSYGSEPINTSSAGLGYDSSSYSSRFLANPRYTSNGRYTHSPPGNAVQSPSSMSNYNMQSTTLQQAPQNRSRLRAASASLPLGLDLRNQYRSVSTLDPVTQSQASTPRAATAHFNPTSTHTSSYPSAPLTAPIDFNMPRTPGIQTTQDYSMPQMSAPIAPSNDFSQAFRSMGSTGGAPSTRTPMRDSFGSGGYGNSHQQGPQGQQPGSAGGPIGSGGNPSEGSPATSSSYPSNPIHGGGVTVGAGMKRKRSFTIPQLGPTSTSAPQPYGNATSMTG